MSVLVVAPHMDDETLGCGGLIQRFDDVRVVFVTERPFDRRLTAEGYVAYDGDLRLKEMEKAAELLGFEAERLGRPVHLIDVVPVSQIVEQLEEHLDGAELVLYPGPSNDEDHEVVRRAVSSLRRPHCYAGSLLEFFPWATPTAFQDLVLLPLTEGEVECKVAAMNAYETQVRPGGRSDPLYPYSPESIVAYGQATGRLCHAAHAEAFEPKRLVPNKTTARLFQ